MCAKLRHILVRLWNGEAAEQLQQCQSTIRGRNKKLKVFTDFHLSVSLLFYHPLLPTTDFFFSQSVSRTLPHQHRCFFCFCFCLVFCLLTFIFCKPTCFPLLSPSVFFSTSLCPTRLHPSPVSVTRTVSCSFTLSFFVILVCLTTGTEMVLEARQTLGDIVLWCMLRQQYFPSAPECLSPPLSVLAFCYAHSSAATMSSSPAAPLASLAHPIEGFSGLL